MPLLTILRGGLSFLNVRSTHSYSDYDRSEVVATNPPNWWTIEMETLNKLLVTRRNARDDITTPTGELCSLKESA